MRKNNNTHDTPIPPSPGYILVDAKKCQGCMSCMLACSIVHEGKEDLLLARIQVIQNPMGKFPDDTAIEQCRQCPEPPCVKACPNGALYVDTRKGNVRKIDKEKCIGCRLCIKACPFHPPRIIWNSREKRALICDLCSDTPFWDGQGKQACVEVCPVKAIRFSQHVPDQQGDAGYKINLRGKGWKKIGYPTD